MMNLTSLFEMQRKLDKHIEVTHPESVSCSRPEKKLLALVVELGECANEWRGFKFWSNDQKPRTRKLKEVSMKELKPIFVNPLLEEYVDGLHFVLSILIDHGFGTDNSKFDFEPSDLSPSATVIDLYLEVVVDVVGLIQGEDREYYLVWLMRDYLALGQFLGFRWDEIENAYLAKNQINHERQETGY